MHESIQHCTPFKYEGKDPLPESSSLIMEERSELRVRELLPRLNKGFAEYEEIIIHDNNLNIAGCLPINNMPLLRKLIVKNRCFYSGVEMCQPKHYFAVNNAPSLKVIDIGDSFCSFCSFKISSNLIEGFLYRL